MTVVRATASDGTTQVWDTDTGYQRISSGGAVLASRPITEGELAWVNATVTAQSRAKASAQEIGTALTALRDVVVAMQTIVDTPNASIGPAQVKDIARAARLIARVLRHAGGLVVDQPVTD